MTRRIDGQTRLVGLLGFPVEHSLSPCMQNAAFQALSLNYAYVPLRVHPRDVPAAVTGLAALGFVGANVTIPHKQAVMPYLDVVSAEAEAIGAVNTIVIKEGLLSGHNVDATGFMAPLEDLGLTGQGLRALVLGAGGAARAVVYGLALTGASVTVLNRTLERARSLVDVIGPHLPAASLTCGPLTREAIAGIAPAVDLVVNTTSLGMPPHEGSSPWPEALPFPPRAIAYDLIYVPAETRLLAAARAAGARTLNGLPMLVHQGAAAFRLWTGCQPPTDLMLRAVSRGRSA